MKYIMLEGKNASGAVQKVPIIFPSFMIHRHTADWVRSQLMRYHDFEDVKVVSAGEITVDVAATFGDSESCKVKADPGDAAIIDNYNYSLGLS